MFLYMSEADFKTKYLKYKKKYLDLKSEIEGGSLKGSVFSSQKVFYAGLIQKNPAFPELKGIFRDGFFRNTDEITMAKIKLIALFNADVFMEKQNKVSRRISEEDWVESLGLVPFNTVLPILLDPLPRLAFVDVTTRFYVEHGSIERSSIFIRNLQNVQELYDAFNQVDKDGNFYTGKERNVEYLKVLVAAVSTNPQRPRLFAGPYAMKGTKHPVIKIEKDEEIPIWLEHGITLSEKLKNDDLIAEYKKNGIDYVEEFIQNNKKEIAEFYLEAKRKFSKLNETQFYEFQSKHDPIAAIEKIKYKKN